MWCEAGRCKTSTHKAFLSGHHQYKAKEAPSPNEVRLAPVGDGNVLSLAHKIKSYLTAY